MYCTIPPITVEKGFQPKVSVRDEYMLQPDHPYIVHYQHRVRMLGISQNIISLIFVPSSGSYVGW
jgi:hypothetical protein